MHLSDQVADDLEHTHTHTLRVKNNSWATDNKEEQRWLTLAHVWTQDSEFPPTSEFVMQCVGELSVQADQTSCYTGISLQPGVTLEAPERRNPDINFVFSRSNLEMNQLLSAHIQKERS